MATPYLYKGKRTLTFEEKFQVLLLDIDITKVCSKRPNGVQENACFVIDRSQLKHGEDWLVTDVGSFENRGSSARVFSTKDGHVLHSSHIRGKREDQSQLSEGEYLVRNVYYRHKKYLDFWRTVTTISDCTGEELQLGMIEYHFKDEEHSVSPHKHPRTGRSFVPTAPSTRRKIADKAKSHKGPTSIFDEEVEVTGGILNCEVMADMPRDIKQVKNARQNLKDKTDQDQFVSLLDLSKHEPSVRNLQWTPFPRVVFCTNEQLEEIVEECCSLKSKSVLSIDTTYNIGDFYMTSTTYQSSRLVHSRTRKPAVLPGPAMFHARKAEKDFRYFSYSLLEVNDKFEDISFVGGDRDKAQKGFLKPLKRSTFLPCKKHVQDDILRKLSDLGNGTMKDEVLKDIFGSDRNKEKGIVDCSSQDEFLAKVIAASDKWDDLERSIHPGKEPEFSAYFRAHIEEDMKDGMLLSARRSAGLEDKFFFNNAQECTNFKYKSKVREAKMENSTGYRPSLKCTWVEAIKLYKEMVEEVNREKQRAVLGKGPYALSGKYSHLEVPLLNWTKMTQKQKENHLAKVLCSKALVDPAAVDSAVDGEVNTSGIAAFSSDKIGSFDDYNFPEFLRGSWANANKIVQLDGIGPFPNDERKRTVLSLTSGTVHTVEIRASGKKFSCDNSCPRFKECGICAHTIAVAFKVGKLKELSEEYHIILSQMVPIPDSSGKKEHEKARKRKRTEQFPPRDLSQYGDRLASRSEGCSSEQGQPYELVFVKDTAATTCYGCKGRVRNKPSDAPPPPPHDVFIRHRERRLYNRPGETKIRISSTPEMVYYHPFKSCTNLTAGDVREGKLIVADDVQKNLSTLHKRVLFKEFGMMLNQ